MRQTIGERKLALHLQTNTQQKLFTGHGAGYVAINGQPFQQAMVVMAEGVRSDWGVTDFGSLKAEHFDYFLPIKPEVILIGTGAKQQFAHPNLYRTLINAGISIEFMDTPAACRTYNILVAEDRRVVAAVLL
ncbi:MAG: Mth938-like domain-containing protein [Sideroxydans sp.]|nr:Mth938-like domain-containing protein [Sideroxydans sp.]